MATPDYSTWLTKQQAATAIGCSTKTVEQLARDLKLQQASWQRPTGGPKLAVYHPEDVARIALGRQGGAAPFVLEREQDRPANGNGHRGGEQVVSVATQAGSRALTTIPGDDMLQALLAVAAALSARLTSESSEKVGSKLSAWMTATAIAREWRWPRADVRTLMADGKLGEVFTVGHGDRTRTLVRRSAVEAFAAGLDGEQR